MKTLVFPGRFDPITIAHVDIIKRALKIADDVIILVSDYQGKKPAMFSHQQRVEFVQKLFIGNQHVRVVQSSGLLIDYMEKENITHVIRGIRNIEDLSWEQYIHNVNKKLKPDFESVFLLSSPENQCISSSIVRMLLANNKDISKFVPEKIKDDILEAKK